MDEGIRALLKEGTKILSKEGIGVSLEGILGIRLSNDYNSIAYDGVGYSRLDVIRKAASNWYYVYHVLLTLSRALR